MTPPGTLPRLAIDPFGDEFLADPYAHHPAMRDAAPVFRLEKYRIFGAARHAEVSAALTDHATFCSGRGVGLADFAHEPPSRPPSLLLETDPPLHDDARRLMNAVVSLQNLKSLRPAWQAKAEALIDTLVARRQFDAITDLAEIYPLSVFPDAVGLRDDGRHHLLLYAAAVFDAFGPRNALRQASEQAARTAVAWVADACRRENLKPGGWGAAIYAAADAGQCTPAQAPLLVRSLLSAGLDTTVNGLGNLIHALARSPTEWSRLRADPSLSRKTFEESLRWDATVQTFFRTTTTEVEFCNAHLPAGAKILLFLGAANRDPRHWPDPDRFDITRQPAGHVAFGHGLHQCLGQMVARQESDLILTALATRAATICLTAPPIRRLNNTLHALSSLPVEVRPA